MSQNIMARIVAINLIFNHNPNLNITRKELKKLFLFTTSQTHFIFNSKFDNQIDGVAIYFILSIFNLFIVDKFYVTVQSD